MFAATQQATDRAAAISAAYAAAVSACDLAIKECGAAADTTDWCDLAPAGDHVTLGYVSATPAVRALVCARALQHASGDTLQRGALYPFQIGKFKTNSLLHAVEWLCDKISARSVQDSLCTAADATNFAHENSPVWHLLSARAALVRWPGVVPSAYDVATLAAAHASKSESEAVQTACRHLARLCFIAACPTLLYAPTIMLEAEVWTVLSGGTASNNELHALFPKVIDVAVDRKAAKLASCAHTQQVWDRLHALCSLLRVPDSLEFDV